MRSLIYVALFRELAMRPILVLRNVLAVRAAENSAICGLIEEAIILLPTSLSLLTNAVCNFIS